MSASSTPPPRRQFNVRLPTDLWDAIEARRHAAGLSRDEWTRRALEHLLATTTAPTGGDTNE